MNKLYGNNGIILHVDLSSGSIIKKKIPLEDFINFVGGRGLGIKLLWDQLKETPGLDPHGPENPLMFMCGPVSGFPAPSSSRTCVVTKSPRTSPQKPQYPNSSTLSYSNIGGFFGPELRFAGYDGIMVTGKASSPVYLNIKDDTVEIRDAQKYWGMGTDQFDKDFAEDLQDPRFQTCYIGPAGENLVSYACILHTAARAAGRGGVGCIMGSKNLKAIAVRGTGQPTVSNQEMFLEVLDEAREKFNDPKIYGYWREAGTAAGLEHRSSQGIMAVKNFREGTFPGVDKIGAQASIKKAWVRSYACYCCPLACKKSGKTTDSPYAGLVHDGPEYETGTMLGANLMIEDLAGVLKAIYLADDYGIDAISVGGVIGFLMEAYDKKLIDRDFLDGIDLKWGDVDKTLEMIHLIAARKGIGDLASKGVRALSEKIGQGSEKFAIHVKGHEFAGHNVHANPPRALCYATANRGACHLNGSSVESQNLRALADSLGICLFAITGYGADLEFVYKLVASITGIPSKEAFVRAGERIFNLEKLFNYREGFVREDDMIADRFFDEPLTVGDKKGAVLTREQFQNMIDEFYAKRDWDQVTSRPNDSKLKELGLVGEAYSL
jgi:aldehyde:ferredoxin oxidoreductase